MAQNDPEARLAAAAPVPNPVLRRTLRLLVGGVSACALMLPLAGTGALAQDRQVTTRYDGDVWTRTYRTIPVRNYGIKPVSAGGAPGNRCAVPAFEVINPRRGEFRCVGYVVPW